MHATPRIRHLVSVNEEISEHRGTAPSGIRTMNDLLLTRGDHSAACIYCYLLEDKVFYFWYFIII